jgi:diguanylate cyclase (GGDEF)-like protein
MQLFAVKDELAALEAGLDGLHGADRLPLLVELAWHLRQINTPRSSMLCDEAILLLAENGQSGDSAPLFVQEQQRLAARLLCVRGEASRLYGKIEEARMLAHAALNEFIRLNDHEGSSDCHWLFACIAIDDGNAVGRDTSLQQAESLALTAGDQLRADVARAARSRFSVFSDLRAAKAGWDARLSERIDSLHPGLSAWVSDFLGLVAFQSSEFGTAVKHFLRTHKEAQATGQMVRAITASTNVGNSFTNLNDIDSALEWNQRGLEMARATGWPASIGGCLMQTAETLRQLGRLEAAEQLLREALDTVAPLPGSRDYAIATEYLGDVMLDRGDYATALDTFRQLGRRAEALNHTEFQVASLRGQAHALLQLDRLQEALDAGNAALRLCIEEKDAYAEIGILRVLARIHAQMAAGGAGTETKAADSGNRPSPALLHLEKAMEVAAGIDGYIVPADVLCALADEYAKGGDYAQAYQMMNGANAAREKSHSKEATNRAVAMQVQYQTERERSEAEHHRQLALSEARRAEVLSETNATLEKLGAIGQEITAQLDEAAVFQSIERHVRGLLDTSHFSIYLFEAEQQSLRLAFGIEDARPVPTTSLELSNPSAYSARCVRERREILVDYDPVTDQRNVIPGTQVMMTQLFAPLTIGTRVLGVMTIQSTLRHAYGEREQLVFRTLCAYGAIALDNAAAYRRLEATLRALNETKARLEEASLTDSLTGLHNRRFLLQHIDSDVAFALRQYDEWSKADGEVLLSNADLVFFMVDLDHFKSINDTYGHGAGDAVLMQVKNRLQMVFRDSDHIIRWGGEEFLVVARGATRVEAPLIAERVRKAIADMAFELPEGLPLQRTCSIGFACFPFLRQRPRLLGWPQVLELADQCLYQAKRSGRNAWVGASAIDTVTDTSAFEQQSPDLDELVLGGKIRTLTSSDALSVSS